MASDVRKEFADKDAADARRGVEINHTLTARTFISTGLEREEWQ